MSPVRTIYRAELLDRDGGQMEILLHGSGFLYHMVRNIVGTLANVGLGTIAPEGFQAILEARDRQKASATAPAEGLYLYSVEY